MCFACSGCCDLHFLNFQLYDVGLLEYFINSFWYATQWAEISLNVRLYSFYYNIILCVCVCFPLFIICVCMYFENGFTNMFTQFHFWQVFKNYFISKQLKMKLNYDVFFFGVLRRAHMSISYVIIQRIEHDINKSVKSLFSNIFVKHFYRYFLDQNGIQFEFSSCISFIYCYFSMSVELIWCDVVMLWCTV